MDNKNVDFQQFREKIIDLLDTEWLPEFADRLTDAVLTNYVQLLTEYNSGSYRDDWLRCIESRLVDQGCGYRLSFLLAHYRYILCEEIA